MATVSVSEAPLVQHLITTLTQRSRSFQSALDIVKVVMEEIEKTSAKGHEKLDLLQTVIVSSEFRKIPLPNALWQSIDVMIDNDLLKPTVEMIVAASNGKLDINQSVVCCATFVQKLFQKRIPAPAPNPVSEETSV